MSNDEINELEQALGIVDVEYDAGRLLAASRSSDQNSPVGVAGYPNFGRLVSFQPTEHQQLTSLKDLVARFVVQQGHEHPLCFAVFGPPGSGKSFAVKQIRSEAVRGSRFKLVMTTINLTQVASSTELASALATTLMASAQEPDTVPMVFFDEFDTARGGAPYGWLSWFLAPMHDGEFFHDGKSVKFKRAIYVFAGGTATTMDEFAGRQREAKFREAKGPDFVSRLRGYLDVAGPNSDPRLLRRALILRTEIERRVMRHGVGTFRVKRPVLEALLQAGRYRHGARSIAALIELTTLTALDGSLAELDWDILPDDHLMALHVDRGPLDAKAIGGSIALSGFRPVGDNQSHDIEKCWIMVADGLWNAGATLAYAGRFQRELTEALIEKLKTRPPDLRRAVASRLAPFPRLRSFLRGFDEEVSKASKADIAQVLPEDQQKRLGVELVPGAYLDDEERKWGQCDPRTKVIERFRRRLAVSEASVARFIVGGEQTSDGKRPSGIVEEAVLSLALGHPIYVAGGFGGAAADLGIVLGLARVRTGEIPKSLKEHHLGDAYREMLNTIAERLRPPPLTSLPVLPAEQVRFLRAHALDEEAWPDNGLSTEQNRALFCSKSASEVKSLVLEGLVRRFGGR